MNTMNSQMAERKSRKTVARIIVENLYHSGVRLVFGVPGAKIDAVFNELLEKPDVRLIICRHEQNAAFMAAGVGRLTGCPGVCLVTSGPGASNLITGLATATTEGDPVVAIVGAVPRRMSAKHTHQSMKTLQIMSPISKFAEGIEDEGQTAELLAEAFRSASAEPKGSAVVVVPMDVAGNATENTIFHRTAFLPPPVGPAPACRIRETAALIDAAKLPVFFLGQRASSPSVVEKFRAFLDKHPIAVVETFQATGAVPQTLAESLSYGRVGLFRNQIGDRLLARSDLVITIGFDSTECDTFKWNPDGTLAIVHIDFVRATYDEYYRPHVELVGSIEENLAALNSAVKRTTVAQAEDRKSQRFCRTLSQDRQTWQKTIKSSNDPTKIQPLHFIRALQAHVHKDTTVTCDIGTIYIYIMRYFAAYEPRRLLCSNGQQTLGVALPWAIAASLTQSPPCSQKVVSLSGDGGFMFSSQELSTAVQQKCNITHFIWNDSAYNMVEFQEEMKYGRSNGIRLGGVEFARYAEAFGAKGFRIQHEHDVEAVIKQALAHHGVSIVDVSIDYSKAGDLAADLIVDSVG